MPASAPTTPTEFTPMTVQLGGSRLSLQVGGTGRPLMLLHSLLADRSSFDRVAPMLARTHRVYLLDLPGFGESDFVDGGLDAVADRVAAGIRALALTDKPILLGNGYGGFVALNTVLRHPDLAERVVLADCGAAFSEPGRAAFRGMSAAVEKGGLSAIADVAMRRLFAPEYQAEHPELVAERRQRFLGLSTTTFHAAAASLATLDLRPQLRGMTLPALVLVGEMDEATPSPMSVELAAGLPAATLQILPGLAHVPQLQAPDRFLAAIEGFISGAAPGA